jgi:5-methylcytosine-specific restriction endonuclease McrA
MKGAGPVTLTQVERALQNLGGQATWDKILAEVSSLRNGDYSHYLNKENYEKTAFQVIQEHCPGYRKYRGIARFEKTGNTYRLSPSQHPKGQRPQTLPEKHTPRATDIEDLSQPERVRQEIYRILRDTAMARAVKEAHQYRCQICGQTLMLGDGTPYAEAHHIVPLGTPHNGLDVRDNILCVCPNDHVLLDYGAIKLDENRLEGIGKQFIGYHNESIYGKTLI